MRILEEFEELKFFTGTATLNYVKGPVNGPVLVLIPAQMGTWESYSKVVKSLSNSFTLYIVELRGHGKSDWSTGNYNWRLIGNDLKKFLQEVVKQPAIIAGNSSGGLVALWLAAHVPENVLGIVLEDAPLFSAEMPRFRDRDKFVYNGLKNIVETIGDPKNRKLANYFKGTVLPVKRNNTWKERKVPGFFITIISFIIECYEKRYPGKPVDIPFLPFTLRVLIKSLSTFDPDFARAFVDGRFYEGLDHEEALRKTKCPILLLHARSYRHPTMGLIGAMDDDDVKHALSISPYMIYKKIDANHVIHVFKPKVYVQEIKTFRNKLNFKGVQKAI